MSKINLAPFAQAPFAHPPKHGLTQVKVFQYAGKYDGSEFTAAILPVWPGAPAGNGLDRLAANPRVGGDGRGGT